MHHKLLSECSQASFRAAGHIVAQLAENLRRDLALPDTCILVQQQDNPTCLHFRADVEQVNAHGGLNGLLAHRQEG
ncbi:hypothetical protein D3C85_690440 [compost metagenome]